MMTMRSDDYCRVYNYNNTYADLNWLLYTNYYGYDDEMRCEKKM